MRAPIAAALALVLAFGCTDQSTAPTALNEAVPAPSLDQGGVPSDGNGNKFVFPFDIDGQVTCTSGDVLNRNDFGWFQGRIFGQPNNRNVELDVFHDVITYTNASGDTFVWRDVGPDHFYVGDGELFVTVTGRSTASGNSNRDEIVVGHVVLNLTTGEVVFVAGNEFGTLDDLACDELT